MGNHKKCYYFESVSRGLSFTISSSNVGLRIKLFQGLGHFLVCNVQLSQPAELRFFDFLPDDAFNWTGYKVSYIINSYDFRCKDFGKVRKISPSEYDFH